MPQYALHTCSDVSLTPLLSVSTRLRKSRRLLGRLRAGESLSHRRAVTLAAGACAHPGAAAPSPTLAVTSGSPAESVSAWMCGAAGRQAEARARATGGRRLGGPPQL